MPAHAPAALPSASPLALRLWRASTASDRLVRSVGLVLLGTLALTLSAKVQVPFYPVPATMQTLVVVLIGAFFGPRLAVATVLAYLAEGAAGLPVFVGTPERGIGLAYMVGPTGGFLAGFVAMTAVAGWLAAKGFARTLLGGIGVALAANVALYAFGLAWLAVLVGADKAITFGFLPFALSDTVKVLLGGALMAASGRLRR
jgi:biotin transport system substrate-specific component